MLPANRREQQRDVAGREVSSVIMLVVWYVTNSHPLRFVNSRTLMKCTDPLRRGVGAPYQCPLGVGSKLPLLLDADVHTF